MNRYSRRNRYDWNWNYGRRRGDFIPVLIISLVFGVFMVIQDEKTNEQVDTGQLEYEASTLCNSMTTYSSSEEVDKMNNVLKGRGLCQ